MRNEKESKRKVKEKFNNVITTVKPSTLIICIWKRICFARKHSLGI